MSDLRATAANSAGKKGRIFSGVQASGQLTLGNYLGAIRNFVNLQNDYECIYCVVDLHAITVWQDPATLAQQTREVAAGFLASGIDPKGSIVFNQSMVSAHAELGWIFNCVARLGWLNRMTQFKDKAGKNKEKVSTGLYVYPNLMAADILTYLATHVPVGEDQKQHLELTRDIAQKFNNDFKTDLFPIVEPLILGGATRVMSLRDGSKKMSKSDPSDASRINLRDDADTIAKKIRKAKTDLEELPAVDVLSKNEDGSFGDFDQDFKSARPEAANLLTIFSALSDKPLVDVVGNFTGTGFADFKGELVDLAVETLGPISNEMSRLMNEPDEVDAVLRDGADRARELATPVLQQVYDVVGLLRP